MLFVACALLLLCCSHITLHAAEAIPTTQADQSLRIKLPSQSDLGKLTELIASFVDVSIKYDPQKIRGNVKLSMNGDLSKKDIWAVYNQVLTGQGFASVVTGTPPVYQILPLAEAAPLSSMLTSAEAQRLEYPPSYLVVVHDLNYLVPSEAVQIVSSLLFNNTIGQVRTVGSTDKRIILAGVHKMVIQAIDLLESLDEDGLNPTAQTYTPKHATAANLLSSATSAWTALGALTPGRFPGNIQLTPDGSRLLLIAPSNSMTTLVDLITDLDLSEPRYSTTYTPKIFTVDDIADLLENIFTAKVTAETTAPHIVRDSLTSSLIVTATAAQHEQVTGLLQRLDNIPPEGQRSMRSFIIKNRDATDLLATIQEILVEDDPNTARTNPAATAQTTTPQQNLPAPLANNAVQQANGTTAATANTANTNSAAQTATPLSVTVSNLHLTADSHTNSIIAIGTPQELATLATLITEIDNKQPQVEIEILMVNLNKADSQNVGVELLRQFNKNGTNYNTGSLFGVSSAVEGGDALERSTTSSGFNGLILSPGDFASVVHAVQTINDGRSVNRSITVVGNNVEAKVDSVVKEPLTNFNSAENVSTTSFGGTTDAGTKISITPTISAADYVNLTYTISQSTFVGEAQTTSNGNIIPPAKREDTFTSVALIPDGHVTVLGGLVSQSEGEVTTQVPVLGSIPLLGLLFKNKTTTIESSYFYIFIRATVLRHDGFKDLKHRSASHRQKAALPDDEWPTLSPRVIK